MANLVLGASFGYSPNQIEVFVKSLRKHYSDPVMLVVDSLSNGLEEFFNNYNISSYIHPINLTNIRPIEIFSIRHRCYRSILEYNFLDCEKILISDVRDVLFQGNPFSHNINTKLEFFLEPKQIKDCDYNSKNIKKFFGEDTLSSIGSNLIACAGTTIGTRAGIINYLDEMLKELKQFLDTKNVIAEDQAVHNYMIYTNRFNDYKLYETGRGPVSTLHHLREGIFNEKGEVININGTVVPIVHQWDRLSKNRQLELYQNAVS